MPHDNLRSTIAIILSTLRRRIYEPYSTLYVINALVQHNVTFATTSVIIISMFKATATNITIAVIAILLLLWPRPRFLDTLVLLEIFVAKCKLSGLRSQNFDQKK